MLNSRSCINLVYDEMHNSLDNFFRPHQEKIFKSIEKQSCGCVLFAVTVPFILFTLLIPCVVIYKARPVNVADIFIDGFAKSNFNICRNGENKKLVILVASSPGNFERRLAIRHSWGSYASKDIVVAFVLGQPLGINKEIVDIENKLYNDIIMSNNLDKYEYLTLKTLSMLKWAQKYCSKAKYVMKTDDDVFLNIPAWLKIADFNETMTIWGKNLRFNERLCRNRDLKYYVPKQEFGDNVPAFVAGIAYMMTFDCIEPLLKASFKSKYVRLEDVFISLMAQEVGISLRKVFPVNGNDSKKFAVHGVEDIKDQFTMWKHFKLFKGEVKTLENT